MFYINIPITQLTLLLNNEFLFRSLICIFVATFMVFQSSSLLVSEDLYIFFKQPSYPIKNHKKLFYGWKLLRAFDIK